jgi:hypothetical protein
MPTSTILAEDAMLLITRIETKNDAITSRCLKEEIGFDMKNSLFCLWAGYQGYCPIL